MVSPDRVSGIALVFWKKALLRSQTRGCQSKAACRMAADPGWNEAVERRVDRVGGRRRGEQELFDCCWPMINSVEELVYGR